MSSGKCPPFCSGLNVLKTSEAKEYLEMYLHFLPLFSTLRLHRLGEILPHEGRRTVYQCRQCCSCHWIGDRKMRGSGNHKIDLSVSVLEVIAHGLCTKRFITKFNHTFFLLNTLKTNRESHWAWNKVNIGLYQKSNRTNIQITYMYMPYKNLWLYWSVLFSHLLTPR